MLVGAIKVALRPVSTCANVVALPVRSLEGSRANQSRYCATKALSMHIK